MRLIDADKLIGALHDCTFMEGDDRKIVYAVIQKQPSAQQWIPCSERLPEEAKEYQVTFASCFDGQPDVGISFYFLDVGWEIEEEIYAWMPLPEPYKKGDAE